MTLGVAVPGVAHVEVDHLVMSHRAGRRVGVVKILTTLFPMNDDP
jgi:hypothetical protein